MIIMMTEEEEEEDASQSGLRSFAGNHFRFLQYLG
jgi:hypothetical protein